MYGPEMDIGYIAESKVRQREEANSRNNKSVVPFIKRVVLAVAQLLMN